MNRYHYIDDEGNISDALPLAALHKIGLPPTTKVLLEGSKQWTTLERESQGGPVVLPVTPAEAATLPFPATPLVAASATARKKGIPKIGKRGWLGVSMFLSTIFVSLTDDCPNSVTFFLWSTFISIAFISWGYWRYGRLSNGRPRELKNAILFIIQEYKNGTSLRRRILLGIGVTFVAALGILIHFSGSVKIEGDTAKVGYQASQYLTADTAAWDIAGIVYSVAKSHSKISVIEVAVTLRGVKDQYGKAQGQLPMGTIRESDLTEIRKYQDETIFRMSKKLSYELKIRNMQHADWLGNAYR